MDAANSSHVEVLGVRIPFKTVSCSPKHPGLHRGLKLAVHVTDACPGKCKFCSNQSNGLLLDVERFKRDYEEINRKCEIDHVYFTGGEPTLHWKKVKECFKVIQQPCTMHTMGWGLGEVDEDIGVSLSRHHWDHERNNQIIGYNLPTDYITGFYNKRFINFACNIIKGEVDNPEDMKKVLDLAIKSGVNVVAFVGLMNINPYCLSHSLSVPTIECPEILKYNNFTYFNQQGTAVCNCNNYCYHKDGKFVYFYSRHNSCPSENMGGRIVYKNGIQPWF